MIHNVNANIGEFLDCIDAYMNCPQEGLYSVFCDMKGSKWMASNWWPTCVEHTILHFHEIGYKIGISCPKLDAQRLTSLDDLYFL